jgi:hypothetical protein
MERDDLTSKQLDYAVFLPALSGFYATYVGKQRHDPNYVDPARIPSDFENGIEGLNWLNPDAAYFPYHWALYSAGHAELDVNKHSPKEDMIRNRDRSRSFILGDSGGFQIGKGVWEGEWKDPAGPEVLAKLQDCIDRGHELRPIMDKSGNQVLDKKGKPKFNKVDLVKEYTATLDAAQLKREQVLAWMDAYMDRGMVLDIPAWVERSPAGRKATGITSYQEAVNGTKYNNEYFIKHRTGACKFLNVLQGENHYQAEDWYQQMKDFCDPKVYGDRAFNGWAMGGQNMCDVHLILKRLVALIFDGLLEKGLHDWMHFLGTSKLEWATLLTDIQRAVRKYHNPNFTISFDCASPFLASANGQIYIQTEITDRKKWVYRMVPSVDDKKYSTDTRKFRDAVLQDKLFANFTDSPISQRCTIKDICIYAPGDLNKIGKEGRTSWDSFSYAIQMGHNVWSHLTAVQEANRQYDQGVVPGMLVQEKFDRIIFRDLIDAIFATDDRTKAESIIEYNSRYWDTIIGTRGNTGNKITNASGAFNALFTIEETVSKEHHIDDSGFDETNLNILLANLE